MQEVVYDIPRYTVYKTDAKLVGYEKKPEILGYPYEKVKYAMLNAPEGVTYRLHEDSAEVDAETKKKIMDNAITQEKIEFWKTLLHAQYFIPHWLQYHIIARFEFLATYINKRFYEPRGDPW